MQKIRAIGACIIVEWLLNAVLRMIMVEREREAFTSVVASSLLRSRGGVDALNVKDEGTHRSVL